MSVEDVSERSAHDLEMMRTIKHHVRTPMTTIAGVAEILRTDGGLSREETVQFLEIITRESSRLAAMAGDVLELANIWAGHTPSSHGDSAALFESIAHDIVPTRARYGTTITLDVPERPFPLGTSPDRALLIVTRMLDWVLRFSRPKTQVHLQVISQPHAWRIEVHGPDAEVSAKGALQPYANLYRHDHGVRHVPEFGLGGRIAHEVAVAAGWTLGVEGSVGDGLRLWADVPR